jgi:hypothetical protein
MNYAKTFRIVTTSPTIAIVNVKDGKDTYVGYSNLTRVNQDRRILAQLYPDMRFEVVTYIELNVE